MAVTIDVFIEPTPRLLQDLFGDITPQVDGRTGGLLLGDAEGDVIVARGGRDIVFSGAGNDLAFGGGGNDRLFGGLGDDVLFGGLGDDVLNGGAGLNLLVGGEGADTFVLGDSIAGIQEPCFDVIDDFIVGEDTLRITREGYFGIQRPCFFPDDDVAEIETLGQFAALIDLVDFRTLGTGILLDAQSEAITLALGTSDGPEEVPVIAVNLGDEFAERQQPCFILGDEARGDAGADLMFGNAADNVIAGELGDDALLGFGGNDRLFGDAGDDALFGGFGLDLLDGGLGDDFLGGGAGDDILVDAAGENMMEGNGGADSFRFLVDLLSPTAGSTTVMDLDFDAGDSLAFIFDRGGAVQEAIRVETIDGLQILAGELQEAGLETDNESSATVRGQDLVLVVDRTPLVAGDETEVVVAGFGEALLL